MDELHSLRDTDRREGAGRLGGLPRRIAAARRWLHRRRLRTLLIVGALVATSAAASLSADEISEERKARAWHMKLGYKGYPSNYCSVFATDGDNAARCRLQCDYEETKGADAGKVWCVCKPGFSCGEKEPARD